MDLKRLLSISSPAAARFTALVRAGRRAEAAAFAQRRIDADRRRSFFLRKLIELHAEAGEHRAVVALFDKHRADKSLRIYRYQLIHATALIETGGFDAARSILLRLILEHNFIAPLQLYRRLPNDTAGVDMAAAAFSRSKRPLATKTMQALSLVDVAIGANEIDRAHYMLMEVLRGVAEAPFASAPKARPSMKAAAGNAALADLHDLLTPVAPFFLISGTLLGVVREGKLLGGDKDIDVGVMGVGARDAIKAALAKSGAFTETYVPSVDFIKMTHTNGVKIDLFFHHLQDGSVWHGSHLHAWDNRIWWREGQSPFAKVRFIDRDFLIPSDPDAYLTENYGDWRKPVSDYDASLEAPNRRIRNRTLVRLHWQKLIIRYYLGGELMLLSKAFHHYRQEFGADAFLREAGRLLLMRDADVAAPAAERVGERGVLALSPRR